MSGNPRAWSPGGGGYSLSSRVKTWWRHQNSPVTLILLAVLLLVFILQLIPGLPVTEALLFAPLYVFPEFFPQHFEPWRMLTAVFLHSTTVYLHILFNGYALWIFGRQLEPILGRARFITLFLVSGFGGSVAVLLLSPINVPVVGASGAIFGMMGAFFIYLRTLGYNSPQLLIVLVINVAISFYPGSNISWQAHFGGLVTGAVLGWVYGNHRYPYQRSRSRLFVVGWVVVLIVLSVLRGFLPYTLASVAG